MKTKLKIAASLTIVQTLLMGTTIASAQNGRVVNDSWLNENYTKREVMVEVRDGEKNLHGDIRTDRRILGQNRETEVSDHADIDTVFAETIWTETW